MRPRLLDLFCGAGGAGMGYHRAGFEVIGVDITPQPHYPFEFHQGDALQWWELFPNFDMIHASPPCQRWSAMSACRPQLAASYPALIEPIRNQLRDWSGFYVIENVPGSPLLDPIELCGHMFGLPLYRHRWFESNFTLEVPPHPEHVTPGSAAGHWKPGTIISVSGHCAPMSLARQAMGIDWTNRAELKEAVPPAYTEWVGSQIYDLIIDLALEDVFS